jgi:hypothetical protein
MLLIIPTTNGGAPADVVSITNTRSGPRDNSQGDGAGKPFSELKPDEQRGLVRDSSVLR